MRDVLAGILIFGGLGAAGYAVWVAVQARRGVPKRDRVPRARTLAVAGVLAFVVGGALAPAEHSGDKAKDAQTSAQAAAVASDDATSQTSGTTATTATAETTAAKAAAVAEDADRVERARVARAASKAKARVARVRAERRAAQRKAARVRARKAARVRARKAADAKRQQAEKEDAAAPASDNPGQYAGMNCTEIGHSFSVSPGSDPDHDADNDGVACESQ
jgi:hypothetical protein